MNRLGAGSLLGVLVAAGVYSAQDGHGPETLAAKGETPARAPARDAAPARSAALPARATAAAAATPAATPSQEALLAELRRTTGEGLRASVAPQMGTVRFLKAPAGKVLKADRSGAPAEARARGFLASHGALVGLSDAARAALGSGAGGELVATRVEHDALGETHVRFKQTHEGLPVFGAELVVHLTEEGVTGTSGTLVPGLALDAEPALSREQAIDRALAAVTAKGAAKPAVRGAELYVYRTGLLEGFEGENTLAYAAELDGEAVHEQVWVDAFSGAVLNRIPLRHSALNRIIYTPTYDPANPNNFVARRESGGLPSLLPPVNNLFNFAGQTYNLFASAFGRDSYDGAGATMRSVYLVNQNCPNAYWDSSSTNYCPGFDLDDVVAHEWGHAYTEKTHGLVYAYQSGALNESYSDIYGEAVDLLNGADGVGGANNTQPYPAGQRWMVGEDLGPVVHPLLLRDMWDPERLSYPARVSSANYHCAASDGGGVHTNSGVPNLAFAMLVDGKAFNGQTVAAIGMTKALAIYWRAASVYQTPISNFVDHADALEASCQDLLGQPLSRLSTTSAGGVASNELITAHDCAQVTKAIAAVELRTPPTQCNFKPMLDPNTPAQCEGAQALLSQDWEQGLGGWSLASAGVSAEWPGYNWAVRGTLPDGRAGQAAFAVNDKAGTCVAGGDFSGTFSVTSPVLTAPSSTTGLQARFTHFVETEAQYDGGNVSISVNGGAFTLIPQSAYVFNAPNSQLAAPAPTGQNTNPKASQWAWNGANTGGSTGSWGTTIVSLGGLVQPGNTYRLRFEFGQDGCNGVTGWFVDEVQVYACPAP
ncbi:MAG TPA: M4 family metallopeptidase [Myxococcus sp.]|nr:M4 family metallopeptidase [Myxococcus sp.]